MINKAIPVENNQLKQKENYKSRKRNNNGQFKGQYDDK